MSLRRSGHSRAWVPHIQVRTYYIQVATQPSNAGACIMTERGASRSQVPSSTESRARKHDNNNGVAWKHVLHGRTSITVERGAHKEFPRRLGARPSTDDHVHGSACTSIGHEHMDQIRSKIRSGGERRERYKFVKDSVMCLSTLEYLLDRVLTVGPGLNF